MPVEQTKVAKLGLVFGPYAHVDAVTGITAFGYNDEAEVTRRGANNFGGTGPIEITDNYQGVSGSFTVEGSEGEKTVRAIASGIDPATFVVDNPKTRFPFYIVSNSYEEDGVTPIRGHFINYAKLAGTPAQVGPDARTYNFQAKTSVRSEGKEVKIQEFAGAATPVTSLTIGSNMQEVDTGEYALLVLRQTQDTKSVKVLRKGTDYTETETAITLTSGLAQTEKALVVYIKA